MGPQDMGRLLLSLRHSPQEVKWLSPNTSSVLLRIMHDDKKMFCLMKSTNEVGIIMKSISQMSKLRLREVS